MISMCKKNQADLHIQEVTSMDLSVDWENVFEQTVSEEGLTCESVSDALVMSLCNLGKVDIEYISALTGQDYKTVISKLKGAIYQNPLTWGECFFKGWETAEEYLSGNIMRKLKAARKAVDEYGDYFKDNVEALKKVLPPFVNTDDIYVTLGSPWLPTNIVDEFILYLDMKCGSRRMDYLVEGSFATKHDEVTGVWEVPSKNRMNWRFNLEYGTLRIGPLEILEKTLNMKSIVIYDYETYYDAASGKEKKKAILNRAETLAAVAKQEEMVRLFKEWVWTKPKRRKQLEEIFMDLYGCVRKRNFDGSFLEFPNMAEGVELMPYQKNAVARILFTPNTLLAHDVGAGKTYVMIAAGMESKRMGLAKKNMYVVPNNIVGQWRDIFNTMYPDANILCIEPKTFKPNKRQAVLADIRDNEYDAVIIAYSCFNMISVSRAYRKSVVEEELIRARIVYSKPGKHTNSLEKKIISLEKELDELVIPGENEGSVVYFNELGIDRLYVDEAHNYKNVPLMGTYGKMLGITLGGSKTCESMLEKVRMVQKRNDGGGVVFATGTPITNSITDAYVMQYYLQPGELALLNLHTFDNWTGMFAEKTTQFEIDVDTNSYRLATRFAQFHNLPELTAMLASIADFYQVRENVDIPKVDGYDDVLIERTPELEAFLKDISKRADDVRGGVVRRKEDNLLKITTDGRLAALDIRLVNASAKRCKESKAYKCADNVAALYYKYMQERSTQLIFCDSSTPKPEFNVYSEIKLLLVDKGIPEEQIAFIHDADTEARRNALFEKLRRGEVRILIGSTFKLGMGVNIQDKLIALHHVDVPWRPSDMTQREGRILRQGNENSKVRIYRYITKGSFDAYSWQLLETKARFIEDLLSGSITARQSDDIENVVLNYAEIKALAVGNPKVKERVEVANELSRYISMQHKLVENRANYAQQLLEVESRIKSQDARILDCKKDIRAVMRNNNEENEKYKCATEDRIKELDKEKAEVRKSIRETIQKGLLDNTLETKERQLLSYRGFEIILPANMDKLKPYLYIVGNTRYRLELGDSAVGNLSRIDNFIDGLEKYLFELIENMDKLKDKRAGIKAELDKDEDYSEEIAEYKAKLKQIDNELGVGKNE